MPLDDDDEDGGVLGFLLGAIGNLFTAAVTDQPAVDPDEPPEPRDPAWLRWLKFLAVILFPAIFVGAVCFGIVFFIEYELARHSSSDALNSSGDHVFSTLKYFVGFGAAIGSVPGIIYVIRCLIRKEDP